MTATLCPHSFNPTECLICPTVAGSRPERGSEPGRPARRGGTRVRLGGAGLVVALVVLALVGWWVVAVVALALRLIELVAVAIVAGWVGWRLGVHHGRQIARR